jgi:hypothetical protein
MTIPNEKLIATIGYNLYRTTSVGNPAPIVKTLGDRMRDPRPGDLVLEVSSIYWKMKQEPFDASNLGFLTRTAMEPVFTEEEWNEEPELGHDNQPLPYGACPTEKVYYINRLDGKGEVRWHNAAFIALPIDHLNNWT